MKSNQASYRIATVCKTPGVSTSGDYAWLTREPSARFRSNVELGNIIEPIHWRSRNTYGRPRISAELKDIGRSASTGRLAELHAKTQFAEWSTGRGRRRHAGGAASLFELQKLLCELGAQRVLHNVPSITFNDETNAALPVVLASRTVPFNTRSWSDDEVPA